MITERIKGKCPLQLKQGSRRVLVMAFSALGGSYCMAVQYLVLQEGEKMTQSINPFFVFCFWSCQH